MNPKDTIQKKNHSFISQWMGIIDHPAAAVNAHFEVIAVNRACVALFGLDHSVVEGMPFHQLCGVEQRVCEPLYPDDLSKKDTRPGEEISCVLQGRGCPRVRIRRQGVMMPEGNLVYVLHFHPVTPWEQPESSSGSHAPVVFLELSQSGRLVFGSDVLSDVLSISRSRLQGISLIDLIADHHKSSFDVAWEGVLSGKAVKGSELCLVNNEGEEVPFWLALFPVSLGPDRDLRVRGIAIHLGVQRSLAYALEAAEERFNVLFRESSDPVLILSVKGEILSANHSFERVTGIQSAQLFRGEKNWEDFVYSEDCVPIQKSLNWALQRDGAAIQEFRMRCEDGSYLWFEQSVSTLHDEHHQARGLVTVLRNIHGRKTTEEELRNQAQHIHRRHQRAQSLVVRLKSFFTRIGALPTTFDDYMQGVCDLLSDMYPPFTCVIFIEGKQHGFYCSGDRPDQAVIDLLPAGMCRHVMTNGAPFYSNALHQDPAFNKDPVREAFQCKTYLGAPLRDSRGHIHGTLCILDDQSRVLDSVDVEMMTVAGLHVAARLRAEEQELIRRDLETHLRQAQKMEAVGLLAGGIAHDFNNILGGILGLASFLRSRADKETELFRDLGLIEQSAERAADLTTQLLTFSRHKNIERIPVAVDEVVREVMNLLTRSLPKAVRLDVDLPDTLPRTLGDPGQLHQVLMNLCINASDAMPEGGVLSLQVHHRHLTGRERSLLQELDSDECICIQVRDNGQGIPPDVLEHVFEPFFTTKQDRGGSGLGLSVAYGIVKGMGGDIRVESAVSEYTCFRVYLPISMDEAPLQAEPAQISETHGTEHILVVDDEAIVGEMVRRVLTERGYNVHVCTSGEQAVEFVKAEHVDMVLLDMVMPGMDGEATFEALRKIRQDIRVLLTSGYSDEARYERMKKDGVAGMVFKPYRSQDLLQRIRSVLNVSG